VEVGYIGFPGVIIGVNVNQLKPTNGVLRVSSPSLGTLDTVGGRRNPLKEELKIFGRLKRG